VGVTTKILPCELRLRTPYRGIETGRDILRIDITTKQQHVVIDVDDLAIEVREDFGLAAGHWGCFVLGAGTIDTLFVVERPPRSGFLTWFGVFARRRGRADRLLFETREGKIARIVERTIERHLGLDDKPVRGELRVD
jgi:hypothetical protein